MIIPSTVTNRNQIDQDRVVVSIQPVADTATTNAVHFDICSPNIYGAVSDYKHKFSFIEVELQPKLKYNIKYNTDANYYTNKKFEKYMYQDLENSNKLKYHMLPRTRAANNALNAEKYKHDFIQFIQQNNDKKPYKTHILTRKYDNNAHMCLELPARINWIDWQTSTSNARISTVAHLHERYDPHFIRTVRQNSSMYFMVKSDVPRLVMSIDLSGEEARTGHVTLDKHSTWLADATLHIAPIMKSTILFQVLHSITKNYTIGLGYTVAQPETILGIYTINEVQNDKDDKNKKLNKTLSEIQEIQLARQVVFTKLQYTDNNKMIQMQLGVSICKNKISNNIGIMPHFIQCSYQVAGAQLYGKVICDMEQVEPYDNAVEYTRVYNQYCPAYTAGNAIGAIIQLPSIIPALQITMKTELGIAALLQGMLIRLFNAQKPTEYTEQSFIQDANYLITLAIQYGMWTITVRLTEFDFSISVVGMYTAKPLITHNIKQRSIMHEDAGILKVLPSIARST
jgi:hypothetical protein